MKATQFIKDHGLEKAREVVAASANALVQFKDGSTFHVNDLKRLVESVALVNKLNGIDKCKGYVQVCFFKGRDKYGNRIKQAITDYESIYGEGNEK